MIKRNGVQSATSTERSEELVCGFGTFNEFHGAVFEMNVINFHGTTRIEKLTISERNPDVDAAVQRHGDALDNPVNIFHIDSLKIGAFQANKRSFGRVE